MAGKSSIEWTDATWNPIVGCSIVSPGCTNCYAMRDAWRKHHIPAMPHYRDLTKKVNGNAVWTGKLAMAPDSILLAPLKRKKPTKYFVNSMGDLFHEDCPDEWIDKVFAVMALAPQHTFQVLTKRAARMQQYISAAQPRIVKRSRGGNPNVSISTKRGYHSTTRIGSEFAWPLPNVWLGVSTERQQEADERIPLLLQTPAAVRFISAEPLLGPINLTSFNHRGVVGGHSALHDRGLGKIDWVIAGGESGPKARPSHPEWIRSLRDQCKSAGVAYHLKQWGEWAPHRVVAGGGLGGDVRTGRVRIVHPSGRSEVEVFEATRGHNTEPGSRYMARVGKKSAGRLLDGVEHNEFPTPRAL